MTLRTHYIKLRDSFTLNPTSGAANGSAPVDPEVPPPPPPPPPPPSEVVQPAAVVLNIGESYTFNLFSTLVATGRTYSVTNSQDVPTGLTFNASTGVITGAPTEAQVPRDAIFSITDEYDNTVLVNLPIAVRMAAPTASRVNDRISFVWPAVPKFAQGMSAQISFNGTPVSVVDATVDKAGTTEFFGDSLLFDDGNWSVAVSGLGVNVWSAATTVAIPAFTAVPLTETEAETYSADPYNPSTSALRPATQINVEPGSLLYPTPVLVVTQEGFAAGIERPLCGGTPADVGDIMYLSALFGRGRTFFSTVPEPDANVNPSSRADFIVSYGTGQITLRKASNLDNHASILNTAGNLGVAGTIHNFTFETIADGLWMMNATLRWTNTNGTREAFLRANGFPASGGFTNTLVWGYGSFRPLAKATWREATSITVYVGTSRQRAMRQIPVTVTFNRAVPVIQAPNGPRIFVDVSSGPVWIESITPATFSNKSGRNSAGVAYTGRTGNGTMKNPVTNLKPVWTDTRSGANHTFDSVAQGLESFVTATGLPFDDALNIDPAIRGPIQLDAGDTVVKAVSDPYVRAEAIGAVMGVATIHGVSVRSDNHLLAMPLAYEERWR